MTAIALLGLLVAGIVFLGAGIKGRAHTVVRFSDSQVEVLRGRLPPTLLDDLRGLRWTQGSAPGSLEIRGQGESLELTTHDLAEDTAQRIRNIVLLRKSELGP